MKPRRIVCAVVLVAGLAGCGAGSEAAVAPSTPSASPTAQGLSVKDRDACGTYTQAATQAMQTVLRAGSTGAVAYNQAVTFEAQRMREASIKATDAGLASDMKDSSDELARLQINPSVGRLPDVGTFNALTTEVLDRCR